MSTGKDFRNDLPTVSYGHNSKSTANGVASRDASNVGKKRQGKDSITATIANLPETFVRISFEDIDLGECCGEGSFGTVYKAKWKSQGGKDVAVKTLNRMDEEVHIISVLSHRNIIQFYGACAEMPNFCLVTEFAPYGSLYSFLASPKSENLEFAQLLSWARDVAQGMNYLHEQAPIQVVHRDLKSKNVLICRDFSLKICDFGASRLFDETTVMTTTGTYPWMAPELIQGLPTSEMCDVYSYGVVLWELLTREVPFKGLQGFQVAWIVAEKQERPLIPTTCPHKLAEMMQKCWSTDPAQRPTFGELIVEINTMINDTQLEKETDTFVHAKRDWIDEVKTKMKDIHKQEIQLETKKTDLQEREEILKKWSKQLKNELREKSLHNIMQYSKTKESFNCKFSSNISGDVDPNTVKDVMNQFMSKSNLPHNRSHDDFGKKMENFQSSHSPTSIIGMPLSRQGSSSSVESSRSLSLNSEMNYDMSKVNINTSPVSFLDGSDGAGAIPKSKDKQTTVSRSRTKLQKQMSSSSEEFQFEGLKLARGGSVGDSTPNSGIEVNKWESKAKFKDSQENFLSENESTTLCDTASTITPKTNRSPSFEGVVSNVKVMEEALSRMKLAGFPIINTLNFASQLSKQLQQVMKEKRDISPMTSLTGNGDNGFSAKCTSPPFCAKLHSPVSDKILSPIAGIPPAGKSEFRKDPNHPADRTSILSRSCSSESEKKHKNACTQTSAGRDCVKEKFTQTNDEAARDVHTGFNRKMRVHCLQRPAIAELYQDVHQSDATDELKDKFEKLPPRPKNEGFGDSGRRKVGPSTITTQSINNSLSQMKTRGLGIPRRRVTITGAPPFNVAHDISDFQDARPASLSPRITNMRNAIDISNGRGSVFETDDFTYIIRPNMSH